jgi:UDP-2,3-diacylglucosamine pyrophosphatase LpxH
MTELDSKLNQIVKKMDLNIVDKSFYQLQKHKITTVAKKVLVRHIDPIGSNSITLIPMADLHLGHKNCNYDKVEEYLKFIAKTENCYTIFLGDESENATKTSVGMGMFEEVEHVPDQIKTLYELLRPLAVKNKILGMVTGNHGMRMANMIGINPTQTLAELLKIPYLGYQGFINLIVGEQEYSIAAFHGTGGGSMNSGKVASAEKISKVVISDLYITGHTHIRHKTEDCIYEFVNGELVQRIRHYVTCGSFLEYFGGYAEMKGLPSSPTGSVCIELMADYKNIVVHI